MRKILALIFENRKLKWGAFFVSPLTISIICLPGCGNGNNIRSYSDPVGIKRIFRNPLYDRLTRPDIEKLLKVPVKRRYRLAFDRYLSETIDLERGIENRNHLKIRRITGRLIKLFVIMQGCLKYEKDKTRIQVIIHRYLYVADRILKQYRKRWIVDRAKRLKRIFINEFDFSRIKLREPDKPASKNKTKKQD